jgi:hypothetical protein
MSDFTAFRSWRRSRICQLVPEFEYFPDEEALPSETGADEHQQDYDPNYSANESTTKALRPPRILSGFVGFALPTTGRRQECERCHNKAE